MSEPAKKISLITTSINVPEVLRLYRKFGPHVHFFVAGDHKTPVGTAELCKSLGNCNYYSVQDQKELGYKCSEIIGWNNDSRRNIALLEAVKWKADIIVSIDDDMIPYEIFFADIEARFDHPYSGLCLGHRGEWFDVGQFTVPLAPQRGLPVERRMNVAPSIVNDVEIGVIQGIILGVPDTDGLTAITNKPYVHSASDILRNGFVVNPDSLSVFNSQLTAFRRELAPAFAQFYRLQGRNTDIIASLLMRRLMKEKSYVYFGPPMGFHARKSRPLWKDLKAEIAGIDVVEKVSWSLENWNGPKGDVVDMVRSMILDLKLDEVFSSELCLAYEAWLDDIEGVL